MNKAIGVIIGVIVLALVIWGLSQLPAQAPTEPTGGVTETGPIKIGFIGPLTGDASSIGTVNKVAVELATEEVNSVGGVNGRNLEVIYEDGKCNATAANSAAQKLINVDGVKIIIGGLCSTETSAFGPMAMQNKVIVLSYGSSAPSLSQLGQYFFRSYPSDAFQGKFAADYAFNALKAKKVAILYHVSDWGTGIKNVFVSSFRDLGGEVLVEEGAPQDSRDYRTALTKIKSLKPDLIYMPLYPEGGIVALKQAKDLGIKIKILGGDTWGDPKLQKEVGGGDILFVEVDTPLTDEFKTKITSRTNSPEVPLGTGQAYDNVKIIAMVLSQLGGELKTDAIQAALRSLEYDGISGHIAFDSNGDLKTANYAVKKIENGTAVKVE